MKKICLVALILMLGACVRAGDFSPERHAQYEIGKPDCDKTPQKCINNVPW